MKREDYLYIFEVLCDAYPHAQSDEERSRIRKAVARIENIVGQLRPFHSYPWPDHKHPDEELA